MTVHQYDFEENFDYLKRLCEDKLIYGLGISLMDVKPAFIEKVKQIPTAVIHVINGIVKINQLQALKNNNLKILILGYKEVRRGKDLYSNEKSRERIDFSKDELYEKLPQIINENWFNVVFFDNLSIKQLDVKRLMSPQEWEHFYMGDDGLDGKGTSASMFVDVVEHKFAKNSCDLERYDLMDTIDYTAVYREVKQITEQTKFQLLEALSQTIADRILAMDARIEAVTVRVRKPSAPMPGAMDFVQTEITRRRKA
jgi:dihydroneopterin aldolase